MSTKTKHPSTALDLAQEYIDDVMKINSQFGMGNFLSDDTYHAAVEAAANAFSRIPEQNPEFRQTH